MYTPRNLTKPIFEVFKWNFLVSLLKSSFPVLTLKTFVLENGKYDIAGEDHEQL
jgi:hypothetical protein